MEQFVSNFEEACARKGISTVLPDVSSFPEYLQKHTIANYKLSVIIGVNNDEWTPDIKDTDQYKYYPWFRIEEDDMGPAGFRLSYDVYDYFYSTSVLGVRLACKSSELAKFMGEKGAINEASKKFLRSKIMELLAGEARDIKAPSLDHGNLWEPFAKQQVANKYQSEYFEADYIQNSDLIYHGGSPDGLITINGVLTTPEIKCPVWDESLNNRQLLATVEMCKKGYPEIYWQCQSNMHLQKTDQALAVSFHAKLPLPFVITDLIIPRRTDEIGLMLENMETAYEWMVNEAEPMGIDIPALYAEYAKPVTPAFVPVDLPQSS